MTKKQKILDFLKVNKQPLTISELARKLSWEQSVASLLLNEMTEEGIVEFRQMGSGKFPVLIGQKIVIKGESK